MNQNNLGTPSYSFNRRPARESIVYQNNLAICPRLLCPASVGSVPGDAFSEASRNFVTTHGFEYYHRQPPQSSWPTPPPSVVPSESEPFHESSPDFEALHGNTASLSNAQMVMAQADGGNLLPQNWDTAHNAGTQDHGHFAPLPVHATPFEYQGHAPCLSPPQAPVIAQSSQTPPLLIIPQATCKVRGARDWPGDDALIYFPMANGQVLPVRDAIEGRVTGLIGRDDKALFTGHTGTAVSLRINWPAHTRPWSRQMKTFGSKGRHPDPFTRTKVAMEAAKIINRFIEEMKNQEIDGPGSEWRISPSHICIDNLGLVALRRVSKASYQPVLALLT